ncbi:MAG TPA: hypothetical protein VFQ65_18760, partial [Kofleriaceae bacterium]|nr:hypothetical protein [Kofleriaceae bacterium]
MRILVALVVAACGSTTTPVSAPPPSPSVAPVPLIAAVSVAPTTAPRVTVAAIADAKAKLVAKYGAHDDISRGVDQVAALWRAS